MTTQNVAPAGWFSPGHDVVRSQPGFLDNLQCLSIRRQGIVSRDRTQAVLTSGRGRNTELSVLPTLQETRSRGCQRAPRQFLPFAQLPSWPHVHQSKKKLSTWKSQSRLSQSTRANTSNSWGQAVAAVAVGSAPFYAPFAGGAV